MNKNILDTVTLLAKSSTVKRGKVGAILYRENGTILCKGTNTNIFGMGEKRSIHAEAYVIKKAEKLKLFNRFPKEVFNLLVVRWSPLRNGLGNSMPCINCQKLLSKYSNIEVSYSNCNGEIKHF
jgi:cytidine deaminase